MRSGVYRRALRGALWMKGRCRRRPPAVVVGRACDFFRSAGPPPGLGPRFRGSRARLGPRPDPGRGPSGLASGAEAARRRVRARAIRTRPPCCRYRPGWRERRHPPSMGKGFGFSPSRPSWRPDPGHRRCPAAVHPRRPPESRRPDAPGPDGRHRGRGRSRRDASGCGS